MQSVQANLSEETDAARLFVSSAPFGPVQVIVINHAIVVEAYIPVIDMTLDQWNTTLSANLTSVFLVVREYLRQLDCAHDGLKEKAAITFVGSTGGIYGSPGHSDYAATKSGASSFPKYHFASVDIVPAMMHGLTLSLKHEILKIAPKGRVNSVGPGYTITPMVEDLLKNQEIVDEVLATYAPKSL